MNRRIVPTASMMKVSRRTPLTITMKSRRGVWRKVDWTISRPLKEIPRPIRPKRTTEKVMIPSPPIWKRTSVTIWPAKERSFPISMTARPVTQTAEAEENRASTKLRLSPARRKGQPEQDGPDQDQQGKAEDEDPGRREVPQDRCSDADQNVHWPSARRADPASQRDAGGSCRLLPASLPPSVPSVPRRITPGGRADGDGGIGHVEGRPVVGADIDVEKIDHLAEADPVDEVPHGPGQDQRKRQDQRRLLDPARPEIVEDEEDRRHGHGDEEDGPEQRRGAGQKAEGGAGIAHMDDVEEPVDDGKALMEPAASRGSRPSSADPGGPPGRRSPERGYSSSATPVPPIRYCRRCRVAVRPVTDFPASRADRRMLRACTHRLAVDPAAVALLPLRPAHADRKPGDLGAAIGLADLPAHRRSGHRRRSAGPADPPDASPEGPEVLRRGDDHGGIERMADDLVLPGRLDGLGHLPLDGDQRLPFLRQLRLEPARRSPPETASGGRFRPFPGRRAGPARPPPP